MVKITAKPAIKTLKLQDIKPNPENPREISNEAIDGLKESLSQFGYIDLIVVNKRNMEIISGHQRYKVLTAQGVKSASCILVDVNKKQQDLMAITLNNQNITGYWTGAIIGMLENIRKNNPDEYLKLRLKQLRQEVSELEQENIGAGNTLPDDIPKPPKKAITKKGDLWVLGEHKLLCGDSTNANDINRLMNGHKAQLFATDPPYLVDYTGKDRPTGGKDWSDVYHEIDIKNAKEFMLGFLREGIKVVDKNAAIYLWHASKKIVLLHEVLKELNILAHQQIIWVKPCAILTYSVYLWKHEPCLLGWQKGSKPYYRPHAKAESSIWEIDLMRQGDPLNPEYYADIWKLDFDGKKRNIGIQHPTVKPTEVFAIPMRMHTNPGDICYEPFSGSGSQIIAGERLNRRVFAMEIEPVFCDVAVQRWEEFSGKEAKLLKS